MRTTAYSALDYYKQSSLTIYTPKGLVTVTGYGIVDLRLDSEDNIVVTQIQNRCKSGLKTISKNKIENKLNQPKYTKLMKKYNK